jgi:hypothetical protein
MPSWCYKRGMKVFRGSGNQTLSGYKHDGRTEKSGAGILRGRRNKSPGLLAGNAEASKTYPSGSHGNCPCDDRYLVTDGSLSALAQQFGGMGGLAGLALPGGTTASEIVALLESNILREKVIERYNLMPVLFYEEWDAEKKDWKRGGIKLNPLYYVKKLTGTLLPEAKGVKKKDDDVPDIWDGIRMLDDDIVNVKNNIKDNTITITADFHDAETAAKIVDYFLLTLTDHMSSEAKRVATINKQYLEGELGKTADPLLKQKIYEMIAQQLETSMTAEVKENFAFKVIDPPKAPDKKIKPKRALMVILSVVLSVFIGVFVAFFMEYWEKVKSKGENT